VKVSASTDGSAVADRLVDSDPVSAMRLAAFLMAPTSPIYDRGFSRADSTWLLLCIFCCFIFCSVSCLNAVSSSSSLWASASASCFNLLILISSRILFFSSSFFLCKSFRWFSFSTSSALFLAVTYDLSSSIYFCFIIISCFIFILRCSFSSLFLSSASSLSFWLASFCFSCSCFSLASLSSSACLYFKKSLYCFCFSSSRWACSSSSDFAFMTANCSCFNFSSCFSCCSYWKSSLRSDSCFLTRASSASAFSRSFLSILSLSSRSSLSALSLACFSWSALILSKASLCLLSNSYTYFCSSSSLRFRSSAFSFSAFSCIFNFSSTTLIFSSFYALAIFVYDSLISFLLGL
jgi:hypothetical protein